MRRDISIAVLVYAVCTGLFFLPLWPTLSSALLGAPGDNMQDFWNTWYSVTAWNGSISDFFETRLLFYPEGTSLLFHSFAYSNLIPLIIIHKLFGWSSHAALITMHNMATVMSFFLSAIGGFLLARRYTRHRSAAILGGFIFGFSPFHLAHLCQMHVATIQYIPFFVWSLLNYFDTRQLRWGALAVLFYALCALSSWYYLIYIGYFLVFFYAYHAIRSRSLLVKRYLVPIIIIVASTVAVLSPLLVAMITHGSSSETSYLGGHNDFVADILGYFIFHPYHLLGGATISAYQVLSGNVTEATVYFGLINIVLVMGLVVALRRDPHREPVIFCLLGMLFFVLLAGGSYLHIYGYSTVVPLPTLLTERIPFLKNIRTPSRAVVVAYLFLAMAVAMAYSRVLDRLPSRAARLLSVVIPLLIFLDFYPIHLEKTPIEVAKGYDKMEAGDYGILDLPIAYEACNYYMMYQTFHRHPIMGGVVSRKLNSTLIDDLETIDIDFQKEQLQQNAINYIVIHKWLLGRHSKKTLDLEKYRAVYSEIYSDPDLAVFKVLK